MAGIGQSSVPSSDQSTSWISQFNMGRSMTVDNHNTISNKYVPVSEKRRLMPEENGILPPNVYQYSRPQTGFQSSNVLSNDKSFLSSVKTNIQNTGPTSNSTINYNINYQRPVGGDTSMYPIGSLDMSSISKPGPSAITRPSGMSQFLESPSQQYLPTPHRTISSGSMNPNVSMFNGQNMPKIRSGSYNLDSHSASQHWDTQIGNFNCTEFPSLKTKPNTLLTQMSAGSVYNYNMPSKSAAQVNYPMMSRTGVPLGPGEHSAVFSIQQEDFPALPVAQNPVTCAESQRSSSASGINAVLALNSCDNSSRSHSSSIVDSSDFLSQKPYHNSVPELPVADQCPPVPPTSSSASLPFTTNSALPPAKPHKKISHGPNNFISNVPNDMVADAFGLIGLVKLIAINDSYENLNLLAPGLEILSLNRDLDSNKDIYQSYVSPLSSSSAGRPQDMDFAVPKEYRVRHVLLDRLADPLPDKLSDETLFWIFYNLTGEECQLVAARQLMHRQWRYNRRERFWLTRDPGGAEPVTHPSFERGNYLVWDWDKAKRVSRPLTVYYKDLDIAVPSSSTKLALPFCYNSPFLKRPGNGFLAAQSARTKQQPPLNPVDKLSTIPTVTQQP